MREEHEVRAERGGKGVGGVKCEVEEGGKEGRG